MSRRALITNDDGIASPGLLALTRAARASGLDVVVAAPARDTSGVGASLAGVETGGRLQVSDRSLDGLDGVPVYAVEAAPALIVRAALSGAFGPAPDLVLSGINEGPNTGHAVLHSGTVGAALTASTYDRPAAAFSLDVGEPSHWDTAEVVARRVIDWLTPDQPRQIVLNVNIPNRPVAEVRELRRARLARFGAVQATVTETGSGFVKLGYESVEADLEPGTDATLLAEGIACYTPLEALAEDARADIDGLAYS